MITSCIQKAKQGDVVEFLVLAIFISCIQPPLTSLATKPHTRNRDSNDDDEMLSNLIYLIFYFNSCYRALNLNKLLMPWPVNVASGIRACLTWEQVSSSSSSSSGSVCVCVCDNLIKMMMIIWFRSHRMVIPFNMTRRRRQRHSISSSLFKLNERQWNQIDLAGYKTLKRPIQTGQRSPRTTPNDTK